MNAATRILMALVFSLSFATVPIARADDGDGGDGSGAPCGSMSGDADQVAAVRAQCSCADATNHGGYVSCVSHAANDAIQSGNLRPECRDEVVSCAARSTCGRSNAVTCCRANAKGRTKCSIKKDASHCRAPKGGSATVGSTSSCCDACGGGTTTTTVPGTTTTTAPVTTTTTHTTSTTTNTTAPPTTTTTGPVTTTTTHTTSTTTNTTAPPTTTTTAPTTTTTTHTTTTTNTTAPPTTTTTHTTTTTTNTTTTHTTTTTSSTTTTTFSSLSFTVLPGTTSCGSAGLTVGASAPTSGGLFSNTACTTAVPTGQLGLGCLYFGGGGATNVPGGAIPDGSTSVLHITGSNLSGANTGDRDTCTIGGGPGTHCINNNSMPACTSDANCGGAATSCAADANCFFGPPLPILTPPPNGALTTCVLNAVGGPNPAAQSDASGTINISTGASSVSMPLASRVYITGNTTSPCPKCAGTCTYGQNAGGACTAVGTKQTSNDCPPNLAGLQAALAITLNPLTTGSSSLTNATGSFCPSQTNAGAFGQGTTQCISQSGMSPGPTISDGQPHNAHLASTFCIPATGAFAVDLVADLPGPGAFSLNGNAQLH